MKKISNKTKDKLLLIGIFVVLVWLLSSFVWAIKECFAQTERQITEYSNRPLIIRAETQKDRFYNEMWRKQYKEQYDIDYCEWEN